MGKQVEVEWYEHPSLLKIDRHVASVFDDCANRSFSDATSNRCYCIKDYKFSALRWIEERIEELEKLKEMVEALPDDDTRVYLLDEDELE